MSIDIKDLEYLMVEHGLIIRAIPLEQHFKVEVRHKDKYPDGIEYYDEHCKRKMLKVIEKNRQGGKYVITAEQTQGKLINYWGNPRKKFTGEPVVFYDSIEQAVESFIKALGS